MNCALYARVSTSDKGQEVENQLAQLREFAARSGWSVVKEYVDHESGSKSARASFQRMFSDAAMRRFDVVLFWSLDRLTREGALPTLDYLNRLSGYGVAYRSFTEPYLDSCGIFKDAVVAILGTIAKQERLRTVDRVNAGLARARAAGKRLGRPCRVFDKQTAQTLRTNGESFASIARQLGVGKATVIRAISQ